MNLIDVLSKVGPDKIVISIFSQKCNFSVPHFSEGDVHVVFLFADGLLSGGINVVEVVDQVESDAGGILNAVDHDQILVSDPDCIKTLNMGVIFNCCSV